MPLDPEIAENYQALAAQRGWTMEQMADELAQRDGRTAAELRSLAGVSRESAPKRRRRAPVNEG